jgi:hypothetical protein
MSLQRATTIALVGIIFSLIFSLTYWVIFNFNLIGYFQHVKIYKLLDLLAILFQTLPLIIFLFILRKSQH